MGALNIKLLMCAPQVEGALLLVPGLRVQAVRVLRIVTAQGSEFLNRQHSLGQAPCSAVLKRSWKLDFT